MFETIAGGENPRTGGQCKTWHICVVEDPREIRAIEGSMECVPLVFGVETALWSTTAKKAGKWYRGILEEAERFMVRWHEAEAESSRQRRGSAVDGIQWNGRGGGGRRSGRNPYQGHWRGGGRGRSGRKPDQGNAERGGGQEE